MTHFADLTPYVYGGDEPSPDVLNIGWLSNGHSFPRATPDEGFVAALRRLVVRPVNVYRGWHYCEFCQPLRIERSANGIRMIDDPETRCHGEIRVTGDAGITYAAPTLILHYVERHNYAPPEAFVRAVFSSA